MSVVRRFSSRKNPSAKPTDRIFTKLSTPENWPIAKSSIHRNLCRVRFSVKVGKIEFIRDARGVRKRGQKFSIKNPKKYPHGLSERDAWLRCSPFSRVVGLGPPPHLLFSPCEGWGYLFWLLVDPAGSEFVERKKFYPVLNNVHM